MKSHIEKHLKLNLRIQANRRYAARNAQRQHKGADWWESEEADDEDEDYVPPHLLTRAYVSKSLASLIADTGQLVRHVDCVERKVRRQQLGFILLTISIVVMFAYTAYRS